MRFGYFNNFFPDFFGRTNISDPKFEGQRAVNTSLKHNYDFDITNKQFSYGFWCYIIRDFLVSFSVSFSD